MSRTRSEHLKILLDDAKKRTQLANANSLGVDYATKDLDLNIGTQQLNNNKIINDAKKYIDNSDRSFYQKTIDVVHGLTWDFTYGLFSFADDIFDFAINVSGEIGSLFGADKSWTNNLTQYDWQAYATEASTITSSFLSGDAFDSSYWSKWSNAEGIQQQQAMRSMALTNAVGEEGAEFVRGLAQNTGYMIPSIVAGALSGGTASLVTTGIGAFAGQTNDAYTKSGNIGTSMLSGLASAGVEVASEMLVGGFLEKVGLGTNKVAGLFKKGKTPVKTTNFIKNLSKTMLEEGAEEAFAGIMQPVVNFLYEGKDAFKNEEGKIVYFDSDFWFGKNDSVAKQALSGAVLGGLLGGVSLTHQYKALSKDGVNIERTLERQSQLSKEKSKYEPSDPKYKEICDEMSANTVQITALVEKVKKNGTPEQIKNVAMLMGAPAQLISQFNQDSQKQTEAFQKSIDRKAKQLKNQEQFSTTNLFNEMKDKYGADYKLRFTKLKGDVNAKVNNKRREILINSQFEGDFAPALAHEYIGHVVGDSMSTDTRQKIFDKVVETKWFKDNARALRNAYNDVTSKPLWQSEVINNYIEGVLKQTTNAKSIKVIEDVFLKNALLNRFASMFKKNSSHRLLKNDSVLKEFTSGIKRLLEMTDKKVSRALAHHIVGQDLTKEEEKIYNKYRDIFDFVKNSEQPQLAYSRNLQNYSYDSLSSLEDTKVFDIEKTIYFPEGGKIDRKVINKILLDVRNNYPKVFNKYLKEDINIVRDGLEHYSGTHSQKEIANSYNVYLSVVKNINNILSHAVPLNELNVREENIKNTYVLGALVKSDKELYTVRFVVNKYNNAITKIDINNLYAINQKKARATDLTPPAVPSTISISHFLEIATQNKLLRDVLSDDVLKHFNIERINPDKVGQNVKYSRRINGQVYDIEQNTDEYLSEFENQLSDIEYIEKMVDGYEETFVNKRYIRRINNMAMDIKDYYENIYDPNNFDVEYNDLTVEQLEGLRDKFENLRGPVEDVIYEIENCEWEDEPYYDDLQYLSEYFDDVENYIEDHIEEIQQHELNVENEENIEYDENREEGDVEYDFRRIQEESRRELEKSSEQRIYAKNNEGLQQRLSEIFRRRLDSRGYNSSSDRLLHLDNYNIFENIDGDLFHDIFEVAKTYTENGELVDLHDNYDDSTCYLSDDGLSGFAITKNGDLISVFNCGKKRGFLKAIAPIVKKQAKTLDCYASENQNLEAMYSRLFGFKTASIMDYNMEYDHDDIAKNHHEPKVAFMVNTTKEVVKKSFDKDSYDEAQAYQQSFIKDDNQTAENKKSTTETESEKKVEEPIEEDLTPYESNKANEIKESAQEKEGKVISLTSVNQVYDDIEKAFKELFGEKFNIENKKGKARRLFEEYNLSKNSSKKDNCKKFIKDLLKQPIANEKGIVVRDNFGMGTYADYLKSLGVDIPSFINEGSQLLFEVLNSKAIESKTTQKIKKLEKLINKLNNAVLEHKATIKFIKSLNTIRNNLLKSNPKIGNTGQLDLKSGIKSAYASFFAQFRYTKNDYVSMSNLDRLNDMVSNGTFDRFVDSIVYQSSEVNNLGELIGIAEQIKMLANELVATKVDNQNHMNYEQTMLFVNMNKAIYKLYKEQQSGVIEKAREEAELLISKGKILADRYKKNTVKEYILEKMLDSLAPREIIAYMVGGTETTEFKKIYEELYRDPYLNQISKYTDFLKIRDKNINNIRKLQNQKITVNGVKIPKYVLYQFYLNTKSPDNVIRMKNGGISFTEKTTQKLDYNLMEEAVKNRLSENEIADLDALFDLYNGEVKNYVEETSEKLYGFKVSRDNYYPIVGSEAFKIKDLAGGKQMKYNINAMNNGRLKSLSNTKTVIELNINPLILFNNYIESMTITGEIGLASQKLNRLFQMKGKDGESFLSTISSYVPKANEFAQSIFSKLIGTTETIERSGFLDKIAGRFATATLGFNVRSMLKQFGSFFTAWGKVGFKVGLKALVSPKYWKMLNSKKVASRLKENPVFKHRIYENGYIRGVSLSAGAQEFANVFTRKIVDASMKGMELMDRITCYATYTLAQAYIDSTNTYASNSKEYYEAVDKMWTDIILETQSNANRISMSRIRSGEKGWLLKNTFGLFQADSQNKAGLLFTNVNNNINLSNEIKTLKKALESAEESDKPNVQKRLKATQNQLKISKNRTFSTLASVVASGMAVVLADMLADWLYDKDEPKDEEFMEVLGELISNSTIDWIPYLNTLYNWFTYDGAELSAFEPVNDLLDAIKKFTDGEITSQDYASAIISLLKSFGLPAENINKLVEGILGNFNPALAIKYKSIYYNMSQTYLSNNINEQIEKGNTEKAVGLMNINFETYKFKSDDEVLTEIVNLKSAGYNTSIKNVPSTYVNEDGYEVILPYNQIQEIKTYYSQSNTSVKKMIYDSNYQNLSMEEKTKAIKKISDTYYEYALYKVTGKNPTTKLAQLLSKSEGKIDISIMSAIIVKLAGIEGNNRKTILLKELNKITGLTRKEKMLIMKLMGYSVSELNKNSLISYLQNNGFSKEEARAFI